MTNNIVSWFLTDIGGGCFINQVPAGAYPVPLRHGDLIGFDSADLASIWDWQNSGNVIETFVYRIKMPIIRQVCIKDNYYRN